MLRAPRSVFFCQSFSHFAILCVVVLVAGCAHSPQPALPTPIAQPDSSTALASTSVAASQSAVAPLQGSVAGALPSTPDAPTAAPTPANNVTRDPKKVATAEALTPSGVNRYQCVLPGDTSGSGVPIELPTNTLRVCSRFPAMGPCQYERAACRSRGGRVIRFDGVEIDKDVEREYDKQVQRFRLNAG